MPIKVTPYLKFMTAVETFHIKNPAGVYATEYNIERCMNVFFNEKLNTLLTRCGFNQSDIYD